MKADTNCGNDKSICFSSNVSQYCIIFARTSFIVYVVKYYEEYQSYQNKCIIKEFDMHLVEARIHYWIFQCLFFNWSVCYNICSQEHWRGKLNPSVCFPNKKKSLPFEATVCPVERGKNLLNSLIKWLTVHWTIECLHITKNMSRCNCSFRKCMPLSGRLGSWCFIGSSRSCN